MGLRYHPRHSTWLSTKKRKKQQRIMNKEIRLINENIANDDLWKGRFFAHQLDSHFHMYEDASGAELWVTIAFCDKKTGLVWKQRDSANSWIHFNAHKIFWTMNKFITEYSDAWKDGNHPRDDKTDYRQMEFNPDNYKSAIWW